MESEADGYFSAWIEGVGAGCRYALRPDDDSQAYPDPASRFQPGGVHEFSEVIDPDAFGWTDQAWPGVTFRGQVIYELHVGTFTPEGTWSAAREKLKHLADLGVTVVEVMPVAEFFGEFGWGYDGVCWFAPTRNYGRPDDFRAFVDAAHALGIGVILDVVYNHFGPTGNYTGRFSETYVSKKRATEWGESINFDGESAEGVREFVIANAAYWIKEFHLDGLRLDATQAIFDTSPRHILADLARAARGAAGNRSIIMVAENDRQDVRHVEPQDAGGFGLDGLWNDDFHHACHVAATGKTESYYADFAGTPQELVSATKWGFLYQGQLNPRMNQSRGTPAWHLPSSVFINFLENHDQVANSARGLRGQLLTSPGRYRALTTLLLLGPATPMLFMGQEFMASAPFLYFADQEPEIARTVREGRWQFLKNFSSIAGIADPSFMADPAERATFEKSKLNWDECRANQHALALHHDLLQLRRDDPTFARQDATKLCGAISGPEAFTLRWLYNSSDDRLLVVNLGRDFEWAPPADPLVAPPAGMRWSVYWSSESEKYGGSGTRAMDGNKWAPPAAAAIVFSPTPVSR
jgi:maltooligosyltrehalose trehalohydrolase